jgi:hypothetical protein
MEEFMLNRCRPTIYGVYFIPSFDGKMKISIYVCPQQRWTYTYNTDCVVLDRYGVSLYIEKDEFEKKWVAIKDEEV